MEKLENWLLRTALEASTHCRNGQWACRGTILEYVAIHCDNNEARPAVQRDMKIIAMKLKRFRCTSD